MSKLHTNGTNRNSTLEKQVQALCLDNWDLVRTISLEIVSKQGPCNEDIFQALVVCGTCMECADVW